VCSKTSVPDCNFWSCRYLHDPHSIFSSESISRHGDKAKFTCVLCGFTEKQRLPAEENYKILLEHAETHRLRECAQAVFTNPEDLAVHLKLDHFANNPFAYSTELQPWRAINTKFLIPSYKTLQSSCGDICCHIRTGIPYPRCALRSQTSLSLNRTSSLNISEEFGK